ncbi:SWR1-complex protein 5 [Golovinomyces cichoracearum]|uniref:SWR1-complex protein 5 n=1 Tax=Golovinomyces cichoracearum TaxID=62708 RepID=A0A420IR32_9PEZI|nr:SWR1-complex protein 5 [Golovinomyces cichoracearum]
MQPVLSPNEDDYVSSEDSDFDPDRIPKEESDKSSNEGSESEDYTKDASISQKIRLSQKINEKFETKNSRNKTVNVRTRKTRNEKKKELSNDVDVDRDARGEGLFVKTRSKLAQEKSQMKDSNAVQASATIDVDAVWEAMKMGKPLPYLKESPALNSELSQSHQPDESIDRHEKIRLPSQILDDAHDSTITINRVYKFAGKTHSEQKVVASNSAEAKLYLQTNPDNSDAAPSPKPKRRPKLARRSKFEPVNEAILQRSDLCLGIKKKILTSVDPSSSEKKLNTVEKSALDWASFVDKEGIAHQLDAAGKSKDAFKARQEFLARVEQKKEYESRRARGLPV